ncbi:MAG: beta-propeller domain-containing protein [Acidimicrobiales bacterium]
MTSLKRPLRIAPALVAGLLGLSACTSSGSGDAGPTTTRGSTDLDADDLVLTSALVTVDSCDTLLERIKDEAVERVGPYGFDQGGGVIPLEGTARATDGAETTTAAAESESGAAAPGLAAGDASADTATGEGGISGTNNQERGVDEADLVKTDGRRLVVVSGNTLQVIDVTGDEPRLDKVVDLPEDVWGGQLFLDGDRALIMTSGWTAQPFLARSVPVDWYPGSPTGRLTEIDLAGGRVVRTLEFEGGYLSAREIDGTIRIVLSASANRFAFVYPSNEGANDSAEQANRALIEESTIDQWLPTYRIVEDGETVVEGSLVDCQRVHLPAEFAGFGSLIMLTTDLDDGLQINDAVSVFTDAQTVYASTDRVAVATPRWPTYGPGGVVEDDDGHDYSTAIHTFDITDPARADYVASGSVRGHLLNQYSLSEYEGHLRVATTDGAPWWGGSGESESFVTVLAEEGDALRQVGQVGGLGKGEQIFAVRFLGDLGYVVTFEQIDPLYVVDLTDPTDPTVRGELKIPGFSSYLHPLDEGHLLGVGTDGDDEGRTAGAVVSLFDVSDPSAPTRTAVLRLDRALAQGLQGDSYSPVADDAKAFTYWDGTAVVPVSWWAYDGLRGVDANGSDAVVISVDPAGELTELGRISHPSSEQCEGPIILEGDQPVDGGGEGDDDGTTTTAETTTREAPTPETTSTDAEASFAEEQGDGEASPVVEAEDDPAVGRAIAPEDYCYLWTPQITRSMVIDGDLFTVSDAGVKVNRFDGLSEVTWIRFGSR